MRDTHLDAGDLQHHALVMALQQRAQTTLDVWRALVTARYGLTPQDTVDPDGTIHWHEAEDGA